MQDQFSKQRGVSLIFVSGLIAVAGIVISASLPGGDAASDAYKYKVTIERMRTIEERMQGFMAQYLSRPCPADITLPFSDANFGVADSDYATFCTGVNFSNVNTNAASYSSTAGSTTLTITGGTNGKNLQIGQPIIGNGIPAATRITGYDSTTGITIDQPATHTHSTGTSGTLTANAIIGGGVPTKTLGLPDEYAVDGYGRRFVYVMDRYAARSDSCFDLQSTDSKGALKIVPSAPVVDSTGDLTSGDADITGLTDVSNIQVGYLIHGVGVPRGSVVTAVAGTTVTMSNNASSSLSNSDLTFTPPATDHVMWALLSPGKDGVGGVPQQAGRTLENRLVTGNNNADTLSNAFATSSTDMTSRFTTHFEGLVKRPPTGSGVDRFDDIVWYNEDTKNTCALGEAAQYISVVTFDKDYSFFTTASVGDINGDGIRDLIMTWEENDVRQKTYVIFGKKAGWKLPFTYGTDPSSMALRYSSSIAELGFTLVGEIYDTDPNGGPSGCAPLYCDAAMIQGQPGDFDGDGFDDVIVPYLADTDPELQPGIAIFWGSRYGPLGTGWDTEYGTDNHETGANPLALDHGFVIKFPTSAINGFLASAVTGNVHGAAYGAAGHFDEISLFFFDAYTDPPPAQTYIYLNLGPTLKSGWPGMVVAEPQVHYQKSLHTQLGDINGDGWDDAIFYTPIDSGTGTNNNGIDTQSVAVAGSASRYSSPTDADWGVGNWSSSAGLLTITNITDIPQGTGRARQLTQLDYGGLFYTLGDYTNNKASSSCPLCVDISYIRLDGGLDFYKGSNDFFTASATAITDPTYANSLMDPDGTDYMLGSNKISTDINGDGLNDIIRGRNTIPVYLASSGGVTATSPGATPSFSITHSDTPYDVTGNGLNHTVADLNGDGADDLIVILAPAPNVALTRDPRIYIVWGRRTIALPTGDAVIDLKFIDDQLP